MFRGNLAILAVMTNAAIAATPKFEVASIKHCASEDRGRVAGQPAPGRITVNCVSVMVLIRQAYILFGNGKGMNLLPEKILSTDKLPAWTDSDLYTIEAKAEAVAGEAFPGQAMMLGPMMQALLEDRFHLKIHRETRQVPVYALTVGKDGAKLQPAAEGGCVAQDLDHPFTRPAPGQALLPFCGFARIMNNGFDMRGTTMAQLCTALSGSVDRKVIDKTGIPGIFDVLLNWSGGELPTGFAPPPPPPPPGVPPPPGPDPGEVTARIQDALQKLGLKLEPTQGPSEVLVIDHVERPSEN